MKHLKNTFSEQSSLELIEKKAAKLGLPYTKEMNQCFQIYLNELRYWSKPLDLLSRQNWSDLTEHCLDSISLLGVLCPLPSSLVIDLGSGGGLPGIPLKIFLPQVELRFLEPNQKKSGFLKRVIAKMNLSMSSVIVERAEEYGRKVRNVYDLVLTRAVSPLNVILEYSLPLLKLGGYLVAYKGKKTSLEVEESQAALRKLGGQVARVFRYQVSLNENKVRTLVLVKKVANTPEKFPRRVGIPRKRPLS